MEASARLDSLLAETYVKSKSEICGLSRAQFDSILGEIARKYLAADATQNEICDLYRTLRVEELALARSCAIGNEHAWEVFLTRYKQHNAEVREYFKHRPEDLLVLDMSRGAGWRELCPFVERPIPGLPYPRAYAAY